MPSFQDRMTAARVCLRYELRGVSRRDKGFDFSIIYGLKLKILPTGIQRMDDATLGISVVPYEVFRP